MKSQGSAGLQSRFQRTPIVHVVAGVALIVPLAACAAPNDASSKAPVWTSQSSRRPATASGTPSALKRLPADGPLSLAELKSIGTPNLVKACSRIFGTAPDAVHGLKEGEKFQVDEWHESDYIVLNSGDRESSFRCWKKVIDGDAVYQFKFEVRWTNADYALRPREVAEQKEDGHHIAKYDFEVRPGPNQAPAYPEMDVPTAYLKQVLNNFTR